MNNYCKHLKKRNNKPYCKLINKEITFSLCRECDNKEYKAKIKENSFYKIKMHNKSKKLTVTKDTYNYVIGRDNYSCRLCGSTSFLQLYHKMKLISILSYFLLFIMFYCYSFL